MGKVISRISDFVCVCVSAILNYQCHLGRHTVLGSQLACIDPDVKRSEVKVTQLLNAVP